MMKPFTLFILTLVVSFPAYAQDSSENNDLILRSIYFGGGSYYISDDQAEELRTFIGKFENLENYEIIIFSHTDNIGGKEYNKWLSEQRSSAVYNLLMAIPVPEQQVEIRDFGMENPLYTNKQHMGRRANRRVDVILVPIVF